MTLVLCSLVNICFCFNFRCYSLSKYILNSTCISTSVFKTNNYLQKFLHSSPVLLDLQGDFKAAQEKLNRLKEDPGNATKLKIYAFYKQATEGKCTKKKPGILDIVGEYFPTLPN